MTKRFRLYLLIAVITAGLASVPMPVAACGGIGPETYGYYSTRAQCVAEANYLMGIGAFDCYVCTTLIGNPPMSHLLVYYDS